MQSARRIFFFLYHIFPLVSFSAYQLVRSGWGGAHPIKEEPSGNARPRKRAVLLMLFVNIIQRLNLALQDSADGLITQESCVDAKFRGDEALHADRDRCINERSLTPNSNRSDSGYDGILSLKSCSQRIDG
jgi:hypothetical protein